MGRAAWEAASCQRARPLHLAPSPQTRRGGHPTLGSLRSWGTLAGNSTCHVGPRTVAGQAVTRDHLTLCSLMEEALEVISEPITSPTQAPQGPGRGEGQ